MEEGEDAMEEGEEGEEAMEEGGAALATEAFPTTSPEGASA